jgi:hypothetical protein
LGHHGEVLKERDHGYEALVAGLALPLGENDGVLGLKLNMRWVGIDHDDFGEVAVEVGEVLRKISNSYSTKCRVNIP